MSRSAYVYILQNKFSHQIYGAWTVKYEMYDWAKVNNIHDGNAYLTICGADGKVVATEHNWIRLKTERR